MFYRLKSWEKFIRELVLMTYKWAINGAMSEHFCRMNCMSSCLGWILERIFSKFRERSLSGNYKHLDFVSKSRCNSGDNICCSGSRCSTTYSNFSCFASISIGHKSSSRFVSCCDNFHYLSSLSTSQTIVERFNCSTRNSKICIHIKIF